MSTTDATIQQKLDAQGALPVRFETAIVPQATISGRALVAVIAIMTFLASLTTGAVMLVRAAASEWQADVAREITIQIRPVAGHDIDLEVTKATIITRAFFRARLSNARGGAAANAAEVTFNCPPPRLKRLPR